MQRWPGGHVPPQKTAKPPQVKPVVEVVDDVEVEVVLVDDVEVVVGSGRLLVDELLLELVLVLAVGRRVELLVDDVDVVTIVGAGALVELDVDVLAGTGSDVGLVVLVVDVVLVGTGGTGQLAGAVAFRAANRRGSSRRTDGPPKSMQYLREPMVRMTASPPWVRSSRLRPTAVPLTLRRFPWRMTSARTAPSARWRPAWKRKTVPSALSDQPAAGIWKRAHSPVAGLPISSTAPMSVGSSVPPGSGATSWSRETTDRRSPLTPCRSASRLPASSSVSAPAALTSMSTPASAGRTACAASVLTEREPIVETGRSRPEPCDARFLPSTPGAHVPRHRLLRLRRALRERTWVGAS